MASFTFLFTLCVTSLLGLVLGSPVISEPARAVHLRNGMAISFPTASGGALDPSPTFTINPAQVSKGPDELILEVVNSARVGVSTTHARNPGVPAPSGDPQGGILAAGATDTLTIPNGWAGMIAVNKQGSAIVGDESLIEASFGPQPTFQDPNLPLVAIDVSFVAGFSLPIVCTCPIDGNKYLSGCDKNLWNAMPCPANDYNGNGSCKNPHRNKTEITEASDFFKPCQGLAYTFETDIEAESNGECQSGTVRCTIYPGR